MKSRGTIYQAPKPLHHHWGLVYLCLLGTLIGVGQSRGYLFKTQTIDAHETIVISTSLPTTVPTPSSRSTARLESTPISVRQKIREVFGEAGAIMEDIAYCESKLKANAVGKNRNGTIDVGVFQINSIHGQKTKDMLDPDKNIAFAKKLYDKQGTGPWYSSKKCWRGR